MIGFMGCCYVNGFVIKVCIILEIMLWFCIKWVRLMFWRCLVWSFLGVFWCFCECLILGCVIVI